MGLNLNAEKIKQIKTRMKHILVSRGMSVDDFTKFAEYPDLFKNMGIEYKNVYKPIGFAKKTIGGSITAKTLCEAKAKTSVGVFAQDSVILNPDWVERGGGNE